MFFNTLGTLPRLFLSPHLLSREVRKFKPGESDPLPDGSAGGLNAAARPGDRKYVKSAADDFSLFLVPKYPVSV